MNFRNGPGDSLPVAVDSDSKPELIDLFLVSAQRVQRSHLADRRGHVQRHPASGPAGEPRAGKLLSVQPRCLCLAELAILRVGVLAGSCIERPSSIFVSGGHLGFRGLFRVANIASFQQLQAGQMIYTQRSRTTIVQVLEISGSDVRVLSEKNENAGRDLWLASYI